MKIEAAIKILVKIYKSDQFQKLWRWSAKRSAKRIEERNETENNTIDNNVE